MPPVGLPQGWTYGMINGQLQPVPSEDFVDMMGQPGGISQQDYDAWLRSQGYQTPADMKAEYARTHGGATQTAQNTAAQRAMTVAAARTRLPGSLDPRSVVGNTGTGERPWWMNYSNDELMALSPQALMGLPPEAFATMPNDIFVKYPALLKKLTPDIIAQRGFGADFQKQYGIGQFAAQPGGIPTWQQLQDTGVVPPRVRSALTPLSSGGGLSPYAITRAEAGIRRPSMQTYQSLNPTDREALGATYEGVGQDFGDVQDEIRGPGGGPRQFHAIGEAPRRQVVY